MIHSHGHSLRIGTRKSPLALRQVELMVTALTNSVPDFTKVWDVQIVPIMTSGDTFLDSKLSELGGKGLFTKEIDEALLNGQVDVTVHSAKDMPTTLPAGIAWNCALPRADARDYYISTTYPTLDELPDDAVVGTASLRRMLFMKRAKPGASIPPLRGTVQTRLKKLQAGEVDATILAAAGLNRLGLTPPGHVLPLDDFIPSPAQGVIAVHCQQDNTHIAALLAHIHCRITFQQALIERELMRQLDGSCRTPIAAYATIDNETFTLTAMLGNEDTLGMVSDTTSGQVQDYMALTTALAEKLKAAILA